MEASPPDNAKPLPGMFYGSARRYASLGQGDARDGDEDAINPTDEDFGMQSHFEICDMMPVTRHAPSTEAHRSFQSSLENALSEKAPSMDVIRRRLIESAKRAHAADIRKRKRSVHRKAVEDQLRQIAAEQIAVAEKAITSYYDGE